MRFVHAADLHLDSPVEGVTAGMPAELAREVREATLTTLDRLVQLCKEERIDFLLLAGDVYDQADRGLRAQIRFRRAVEELERVGIPVFLVHGNHDDLGHDQLPLEWPSNLHVFPAGQADARTVSPAPEQGKGAGYTGTIARVFGISYPHRQVREDYAERLIRYQRAAGRAGSPAAEGEPRGGLATARGGEPVEPDDAAGSSTWDIALLHANVDGSPEADPYSPCRLSELVAAGGKRGFQYWALGHVHERRILHPGEPVVAYPGNPQGRGFAEPGWRGVYLVYVGEESGSDWNSAGSRQGGAGGVRIDFVPLQAVVWHVERINLESPPGWPGEKEAGGEADAEAVTRYLEEVVRLVRASYSLLPASAQGRIGYLPIGVILEIELTGRTPLYGWLRRPDTQEELLRVTRDLHSSSGREGAGPWVWPARLQVKVRPPIDKAELAQEDSFAGELVRLAGALKAALAGGREAAPGVLTVRRGREEAAAAASDTLFEPGVAESAGVEMGRARVSPRALLDDWLSALRGKPEAAEILASVTPEELQAWIEAAEDRLLDLLEEAAPAAGKD